MKHIHYKKHKTGSTRSTKQKVGRAPSPATDPRVRLLRARTSPPQTHYCNVTSYRRRLPHVYSTQQPIFLTWRLHGSLPANRHFPGGSLTSGQAFAALDHLLDNADTGPLYLRQPALADMVVDAIRYNAEALMHYILHAFAVMPNHVHVLITPRVPLRKLAKSLKGITAKRANVMLGRTGTSFWQGESYDHEVRHEREFDRIRHYIETNPVRAGLVQDVSQYRWSSTGQATKGSPADEASAPPPTVVANSSSQE